MTAMIRTSAPVERSGIGGASVPDRALAVPAEPVARLGPSGFDPSREWMDIAEFTNYIRARFAVRGEASKFARFLGLCDETVLATVRGARPPADELLAALGFEREIFYRRVEPCPCYACTRAKAVVESWSLLDWRLQRYFLCETCGNKRCPHGADHRNPCTGSNAPGQAGSLYENAPAIATEAGTAETVKQGSVHEGAGPKDIAQ